MDVRAELRRYLHASGLRRFGWGFHDCFTYTADWTSILSGMPSPADEYRNRYKTARGALIHIKRRGGECVSDIPNLVYPAREIPPAYASAGDIVCVSDSEEGPALGICIGRDGVFLSRHTGFEYLKHRDFERAWRVECRS